MKFGYVCTNYNNSSYTRGAVSSLCLSNRDTFGIVVVDNNSNEEDLESLRRLADEFVNVTLILNKENVGYFRGLNLGIRHLRTSQPQVDLMVVGNNDLVFPADFTESLHKNSGLFDKYAVVCPDIVTLDGVHQNPHVINRISKLREFVYDLYFTNHSIAKLILRVANWSRGITGRLDQSQHEFGQEIFMGLGACYVLGPVFFRNFEQLWAPTFLFHEEYFLSKQLEEKGLRMYYEPSMKVFHHFQVSMGKVDGKEAWEIARAAHKVRRQYAKMPN